MYTPAMVAPDVAYERIGIRELRADLAAAVRRAGRGERLVVTVGGRAVAELGPLGGSAAPSLAELVALGLVEPPARSDHPPTPDLTGLAVDLRGRDLVREVRSA
jgi:antitoxin (DNA-binding transcriptional repressor) of toxin-antitoxin stability system